MKTLETLETKKAQDYHFEFKDLDKIHGQQTEAKPLDGDFQIMLVNLTDNCYTIAGTRRAGGSDADWKWGPMPRTCRTCSSSYKVCADNQQYSGVLSVACTAPAFDLFVAYPIDNAGNVKGALYTITPDCNHAGGIIGID